MEAIKFSAHEAKLITETTFSKENKLHGSDANVPI